MGNKQSWEILPTTPWNYALELSDETAATTKVTRNPLGDFPFAGRGEPLFRRRSDAVIQADGQVSAYTREAYASAEPVVLKVKGRPLADWGMDKTYPANAADLPAQPDHVEPARVRFGTRPLRMCAVADLRIPVAEAGQRRTLSRGCLPIGSR